MLIVAKSSLYRISRNVERGSYCRPCVTRPIACKFLDYDAVIALVEQVLNLWQCVCHAIVEHAVVLLTFHEVKKIALGAAVLIYKVLGFGQYLD